MCSVSNIGDYYKKDWEPSPWTLPNVVPYPYPNPIPIPNTVPTMPRDPTADEIEEWIKKNKKWTVEKYNAFKKLIEEARKLDALMGEADCEDPEKTKWIEELELLVKHLKARNAKQIKPKKKL